MTAYSFCLMLCLLCGAGLGFLFRVWILTLVVPCLVAAGIAISLVQQAGLLSLLVMGIFCPVMALQGGYALGVGLTAAADRLRFQKPVSNLHRLRVSSK